LEAVGFAKEMQLRALSRGFGYVDGYVCSDCVDDRALRAYIEAGAVENECDFCGRSSSVPVAADADDLVDHISRCIKTEYNLAVEELGWDEGEYVGTYFDMPDLLQFELHAPLDDGPFAEAVEVAAIDEAYCERDYYMPKPHEALRYDWELFVRMVKHESRFMFLKLDEAPPHEEWAVGHPVRRGGAMLAEIARQIERAGLIKHLDPGKAFYRCRTSSIGQTLSAAKDLGSPPATLASANRMSPAGISMFYGAQDEETAIAEIARAGDVVASVAEFVTDGVCSVVDLDEIPDVPSIFDEENRYMRSPLLFLHGFRRDLIKPIERDGREHIEYVPTQIVTEYLRLIYRLPEEDHPPLDGLVFTSSRRGGKSVVLFVDNGRCIEQGAVAPNGDLHLRLEKTEVRSLE
jgi:hypothetical protein